MKFFMTGLMAIFFSLAPLKSFAIGCIGDWPDQICPSLSQEDRDESLLARAPAKYRNATQAISEMPENLADLPFPALR